MCQRLKIYKVVKKVAAAEVAAVVDAVVIKGHGKNKVGDFLGLFSISGVAIRPEYPDIRNEWRFADEKNPCESQSPYLFPRDPKGFIKKRRPA